ncbi:MAG: type II toxin-antitoxin system RelB/DinJ family antitoxin [Lachnospiraceae bacterium]|nr:type II toxin-antitoxin system RelB/DinJ family antitoxin [Lachnospiraceae bacterium]
MSTISLRFDIETKNEIDKLCEKLGISITNFFTIFAKKAIREQAIPFEVSAKDTEYSYKDMMLSMKKMQQKAVKNGTADMSLEEINKEGKKYDKNRTIY